MMRADCPPWQVSDAVQAVHNPGQSAAGFGPQPRDGEPEAARPEEDLVFCYVRVVLFERHLTITLSVYAHVLPGMAEQAGAALSEQLFGREVSSASPRPVDILLTSALPSPRA